MRGRESIIGHILKLNACEVVYNGNKSTFPLVKISLCHKQFCVISETTFPSRESNLGLGWDHLAYSSKLKIAENMFAAPKVILFSFEK